MKNNIGALITTVVVLFLAWVGLDAFFGLVGDLYTFLDGYIWAFFAGLIAFWAAVTIVMMMIYITFWSIILSLAFIGFIMGGKVTLSKKRTK